MKKTAILFATLLLTADVWAQKGDLQELAPTDLFYRFTQLEPGFGYEGQLALVDEEHQIYFAATFALGAKQSTVTVNFGDGLGSGFFESLGHLYPQPLFVGLALEGQEVEFLSLEDFLLQSADLKSDAEEGRLGFTRIPTALLAVMTENPGQRTPFCASGFPTHPNYCVGPCENGCYNSYCPGYQACGFNWLCKLAVIVNFNNCMHGCDFDGDGHQNSNDLCPCTAGPNSDCDGDGIGDVCDPDNTSTTSTVTWTKLSQLEIARRCARILGSNNAYTTHSYNKQTWNKRTTTVTADCATGQSTTTISNQQVFIYCYTDWGPTFPCSGFPKYDYPAGEVCN